MEMLAAKVGNYTMAEDGFDLSVARIECLGSVYFQHYYLMLPHCHLGVVVSQTAHQLEPSWLSSPDIRASTSYVNTKQVVNELSIQVLMSNSV